MKNTNSVQPHKLHCIKMLNPLLDCSCGLAASVAAGSEIPERGGDPQRLGIIYNPDCAACLRGRVHTYAEHEAILRRNREASR